MDHLSDVLRAVDGPYALAGLALLIVAGFTPRLTKSVLERKSRRAVSFSLLALGAITIVGSLVLAANKKTESGIDAATRGSNSVEVHGQSNIVGNGNVVGNGNTTTRERE